MLVRAVRIKQSNKRSQGTWHRNDHVPWVQLPSEAAVRQLVAVSNPQIIDPASEQPMIRLAIVLEVGPYFIDDDAYVFSGKRPRAETDYFKACGDFSAHGIGIGERVWTELQMVDGGLVDWDFFWPFEQGLGLEAVSRANLAGF
jgi:hypothetical protein